MGFKAPKRIDPRLLDPRSVFEDLAEKAPNNEAKVYNPEVKKRKREGYEEGDYTQFEKYPPVSSSRRWTRLLSSVNTTVSRSTSPRTEMWHWQPWTSYPRRP